MKSTFSAPPLYDGPLPDELHGGLLDAARTCQHPTARADLARFVHVNLLGQREPLGLAVWSALYSVATRPGMASHLAVLLHDVHLAEQDVVAKAGDAAEEVLDAAVRHLLWLVGDQARAHLLRVFHVSEVAA